MHVVIQGEKGSFHHRAAKSWFGDDVTIIPSETFSGVFGALNHHDADMALVAVENSLYGSINEVLDLVESHSYPIVGEVLLRIKQQLISLPNAESDAITKIYSHPVALAQCEQFLDANFPNAERIEYHDTAASVEYIKHLGDPAVAAIAGRVAAELHDLPILAENIEDNKANFTRFLVLSRNKIPAKDVNKASLVITTDHTPGALARVLAIFADNDANLTKLQSRPIVGEPWRYRFYIDVETDSNSLNRAIEVIQKDGAIVATLGQYIAAKT